MRVSRWILLLIPALLLAAPPQSGDKAPKKTKGRLTLPAGAEKIDTYTHRYKDKDGKVWIYRQTPFGLVRYEDPDHTAPSKPGSAKTSTQTVASPKPAPTGIRVYDQGKTVKFEKDGPFGKYTWVRKKTELNEQEKQALREAQEKSAAKKPKQE